MLTRLALATILLMSSASARAQVPAFEVPKSWEKLHDDPGTLPFLTARDGYAVWMDQRQRHTSPAPRAISSTFTLYRQKEGDKEPEKLGEWTTAGSVAALVGPKGEIAAGFFANHDTIFLPGKKPLKLPRDAYYAARHFTADGLVCAADRFSEEKEFQSAIVLFPIDREKGELSEPRFLRPWFPRTAADGFRLDFSHGRVFLRGDSVAYTGTAPRFPNDGFPKDVTEVWDVKNQKRLWRADEVHDAADDKYAYTFRSDKGVIRRALAGDGTGEELALPKNLQRLDFQPPKVFGIEKRDKEWVVTVLDVNTGEQVEYDVRVPDGQQVLPRSASGTGEHFALHTNPNDLARSAVIGVAYDAQTDTLRTRVNDAVYKVPAAKRIIVTEKPKWEPLPRAEPKK